MKLKWLSKRDWNFIFSRVPRVTVDIVIKDKRGILLIKRSIRPDKGEWHFAGGTVRYKEKLLHAVKRKAYDETGLQVKVKKFLGICEFTKWRYPGYTHIIDLVFLAEPIRGKIKGNAKEAGTELRFFKKLPKNMIPEQRKILQGKNLIR